VATARPTAGAIQERAQPVLQLGELLRGEPQVGPAEAGDRTRRAEGLGVFDATDQQLQLSSDDLLDGTPSDRISSGGEEVESSAGGAPRALPAVTSGWCANREPELLQLPQMVADR